MRELILTRKPQFILALAVLATLSQVGRAQTGDLRVMYGTRSLEAAQDIQKSIDLQAAGKFKDARTLLEAAEKLDPACDFIFYREGSVYSDLGDIDKGIAAYKKAFELGRPKVTDTAIDAAISLGITYGQLKKFEDADFWFSQAIVTDPTDRTKLLWKAYRNLAITLMNQKQFGDAALAAINGRLRSPEHVERGLVEDCIKRADAAGDVEVLHGLFLNTKVPTIAARTADAKLTPATVTGDAIDHAPEQIFSDPQGRWMLALPAGQNYFYQLAISQSGLKSTKVNIAGSIQSACLMNGHFYIAQKEPSKLLEIDPATGKSSQSWTLPIAPLSIAVFPSTGMAYFPNKDMIWCLNLKTGAAASTDKDGQMVVGHPNERLLFARLKDETDVGETHVLNVDGHQVVYTESPKTMMPTTLFEYYCNGDQLIIGQAREAASSNGYNVTLSGDGQWVALPGGGGWRSDFAMAQKTFGYVIPVFSTADLGHVQGVFSTDAYPKGAAINSVTGQIAAIREQDVKIFSLAGSKPPTQTLTGGFNGPAAWSGDGRFLVLASKNGVVAYQNTLTKDELALAGTWWKSVGPEKTSGVATVAAPRAAPVAALATFQPSTKADDVRKVLTDALKGKADQMPPWDNFAAYISDKAAVDGVLEIVRDTPGASDKGTRLFRLKDLAKTHAASIPLKFYLAESYVATDQAAEGKPLLLDVIHADKGQTDLSPMALNVLARLLASDKQAVPAAHCVALALSLDRAAPQTLAVAAEILPGAGFSKEFDALKPTGGGSAPSVSTTLPALKPLADSAPALTSTALFTKASHSVVLIQCGNSSGSGACIGDTATILTSLHVVADHGAIEVVPFVMKNGKVQRGTALKAEMIASSGPEDLAVLRLVKPPAGADALVPMPLAVKDPPGGQKVYAVGNPGLADQTLDLTMTDGIISANDRMVDGQLYLQHTAGVNPGNSGGPLINERGEIVGVVCLTAKLKSVSFATPASVVQGLFAKPGK